MARPAVLSTQILEGKINLHQRKGKPTWHCAFTINRQLTRKSTGKTNFEEAKEVAVELYLTARIRDKEGLPTITKTFKSVADLAIKRMQDELDSGGGKKVFVPYIYWINNYFLPFFGNKHIDKIDYTTINEYCGWRKEKFGTIPAC